MRFRLRRGFGRWPSYAARLAAAVLSGHIAACDDGYPCTQHQVTARVVDRRDGRPIEGALAWSNDSAGNRTYARTDGAGTFALLLPAPPNTCEHGGLRVEKAGCEPWGDERTLVDLAVTTVALTCESRCVGVRTVRGALRGVDGAPLSGAVVASCGAAASQCVLARADAAGRFSARVEMRLEAGACRVAPLIFAPLACGYGSVAEFRSWGSYDADAGDAPIDVELTVDASRGCNDVRVTAR